MVVELEELEELVVEVVAEEEVEARAKVLNKFVRLNVQENLFALKIALSKSKDHTSSSKSV